MSAQIFRQWLLKRVVSKNNFIFWNFFLLQTWFEVYGLKVAERPFYENSTLVSILDQPRLAWPGRNSEIPGIYVSVLQPLNKCEF